MRRDYESNLDLVLYTMNLADKIESVILDDPWSSDHLPIFINISLKKYQYNKKSFKLYTLKTRWDLFSKSLLESLQQFYNNEYEILGLTEKYSFFTDMITNAVKSSTPLRNKKKRKLYKNR